MSSYTESTLFAQLKIIKENIGDNWSSSQYTEVLDKLLYESIHAILLTSDFIDNFIAAVIAWYSTNARRKISNVSKDALLTKMFTFLMVDEPDVKLKLIKGMRLERNLWVICISNWLSATSKYRETSNFLVEKRSTAKLKYLKRVELSVKHRAGSDLYSGIATCSTWFSLYLEFRSYILEKYTRLVITRAQQQYTAMQHTVELDDIIQVFMLSASKALDKFDLRKGSLTSYIQRWFLNAKNVCWKDAYRNHTSLDALQEDSHYAQLHSDTDVVAEVDRMQTITRVRLLAKRADPIGLGRLTLGIEEVLPTVQSVK